MVVINHVQGRGHDLKETESYSFQMTDMIHRAFIAATSSKPEPTTSIALCAVSLSTSSTMAYFRRFPQAEVEEADYSAAADAAGIRPGEPESTEDDSTLGPNGKAWYALTGSIFGSVTQCRVVNEADVISDLTSIMGNTDHSLLAKGYLRDVSPEDAKLLDGVSSFSLRGMICPGEPEANFIFAGDFSLALGGHGRRVCIDSTATLGSTSSRSRIFFLQDARWCGMISNGVVDCQTSSRGSSTLLNACSGGEPLAHPIIVISYAGNDIFGNYGFLSSASGSIKEMACYSQRSAGMLRTTLMEERVNTHFGPLSTTW